MYKDDIIRV